MHLVAYLAMYVELIRHTFPHSICHIRLRLPKDLVLLEWQENQYGLKQLSSYAYIEYQYERLSR